ncbi:MAG: hypothetical protein JWO38_4413 [Gemmataceae bacterium]|nr:hypothetical protein [Gemmataceae bacterium]
MSGPFPRPAAPGTVAADRLAAVENLHTACRQWTVPVHRPYTDLTFGFGFAVLGDPARARRLAADGAAVLESIAPPAEGEQDLIAVTGAIIRRFLSRVFRYRIEQALNGAPHAGTLAGPVLADWVEIARQAADGTVLNPYKLAEHAINVYRMVSRVVEPVDRADPYTPWSRNHDALSRELAELHDVHDPAEIAARLGRLVRSAISADGAGSDRLRLLRDALPLSLRAGPAFAAEALDLVGQVLADATGEVVVGGQGQAPVIGQLCQLVEQSLFVAGSIGRADLAREWAGRFAGLAERFPVEFRVRLVRTAGPQCLRTLRALGLPDDIDRLVVRLGAVVPDSYPHADPEAAGGVLGARLVLAAGWLALDRAGEAGPVLDKARHEVLDPGGLPLPSKDYTELARAYLFSVGQGHPESELGRIIDLFRVMPPGRVTNTWTTASYFSRSHLILTEEAVAAACRMLVEPPLPG